MIMVTKLTVPHTKHVGDISPKRTMSSKHGCLFLFYFFIINVLFLKLFLYVTCLRLHVYDVRPRQWGPKGILKLPENRKSTH